ncbi:hypothetical protein SLA2020_133000 [Shorea laevis]
MFRTYRLLTKFAHLSPLDRYFRQWKHSFRFQHSLRRFNPRKPTQKKGPRNLKKGAKFTDIKNVEEAKVYMRDTILNIYKILKYSTWDSAEQQLRQLPIKWDSFTVNQVLKTHPPMEKAWCSSTGHRILKGLNTTNSLTQRCWIYLEKPEGFRR